MGNSERDNNISIHVLEIEDLFQRNRDLRNARITLTISVITIFVALWAIILAFISQIVTPESAVDFCNAGYIFPSCECSEIIPVTQISSTRFSLLQFLTRNNIFNVFIFFGILLTIVLFLIWRVFARYLCMEEIKNLKKIRPSSVKSDDEKISSIVKKMDFYSFIFY